MSLTKRMELDIENDFYGKQEISWPKDRFQNGIPSNRSQLLIYALCKM